MYDVIVIGAGPTGCAAANTLAAGGMKVLLAEKFKMPRYKSCSGQLIRKSLDLIQLYFNDAVPASVMCTPIKSRGMIFTNDKGKEFRFEQEGLNVWRSSFDWWLAEKAADAGAEVRDCTVVLDCKDFDDGVEVTLKGENIYAEQAKYVLDCEGVVGALKRKLTESIPQHITTFQTFNKGYIDLDYDYFYAYLQPELSEYDAWFNVKDDMLVLGVAVKDANKIGHYYEQFVRYMQNKHLLDIKEQVKAEKWLMPHIRPGCHIDYGIGRVLFAGEIAGFLNPMGEGISAGMESGHYAACSIRDHFDDLEMIYTEYKNSVKNLKSYMERQWNLVAEIADTFGEMKTK